MTPSDGSPIEWWIEPHDGGRIFPVNNNDQIIIEYRGMPPKNPVHVIDHAAYLQEKQARELAEAERDSLISSLFFAKNQRDNFELNVRSLEEEVACLRSVLSEYWALYDTDHSQYAQWSRANQLADERSKREPKYIYTIEEGPA